MPQPADDFSTPGVFVAPWVGPDDELVLFARDSRRRLVGEPVTVPKGADHLAASDDMWDRLVLAERRLRLV